VATCGAFMAHVCRVFRFISLQGLLSIRIFTTPSEMGDDLLAKSKCSNSTFIMLYLCNEMDVDYLVVQEMINISKKIITIAYLV
jgi:hypothetical protein